MNTCMVHFHTLTRAEQALAIRHLAASGMPEYTIATATELSVEMIRRVLGERAVTSPLGPSQQHQLRSTR
jgi:hypothetical protein